MLCVALPPLKYCSCLYVRNQSDSESIRSALLGQSFLYAHQYPYVMSIGCKIEMTDMQPTRHRLRQRTLVLVQPVERTIARHTLCRDYICPGRYEAIHGSRWEIGNIHLSKLIHSNIIWNRPPSTIEEVEPLNLSYGGCIIDDDQDHVAVFLDTLVDLTFCSTNLSAEKMPSVHHRIVQVSKSHKAQGRTVGFRLVWLIPNFPGTPHASKARKKKKKLQTI